MTTTLSPTTTLTTRSGAPLPVVALPQGELLTVNIDQIPLFKDLIGPGIHIQPLRIDVERGEWVFLATLAPGCVLPLHYHTRAAQVWTIQGRWLYHEYPDQPQTAGSYRRVGAHLLLPREQHRGHRCPGLDRGRAGQLQRGRHLPLGDGRGCPQVPDRDRGPAQGTGPVPYVRHGAAGVTAPDRRG